MAAVPPGWGPKQCQYESGGKSTLVRGRARPQRVDHSRAIPLRLLFPVRSTSRRQDARQPHSQGRLGSRCGMPERTDKRVFMHPALLPRRSTRRSSRQRQRRWSGPLAFASGLRRLRARAGSRTRLGPVRMLGVTLCGQRKAVHFSSRWWWEEEVERRRPDSASRPRSRALALHGPARSQFGSGL